MKSEERHQLRTNDLSVVTTKTASFLEKNLEAVIAAAFAIVVLVAIGVTWHQSSVSSNSAGWTMLDSAKSLEDFGAVADRYKGQLPGQWAQIRISEKSLQNGLPMMFANRELALAELKTARDGFESLVADKTVPATIRERALWGVAQCLEATCDGNTAKCIEAYNRLLAEFPESIFKQIADERVAALKKPEAEEFFAWFSKENPKAADARPDDFKIEDGHLPSPHFDDADLEDPKPEGPADALSPANTEKPPVSETPAANEPAKDANSPATEQK